MYPIRIQNGWITTMDSRDIAGKLAFFSIGSDDKARFPDVGKAPVGRFALQGAGQGSVVPTRHAA